MKIWKKGAALALALLLALNFAGCGSLSDMIRSGFDASGYIRGIMECTYLAEYELYMELTDATLQESEEAYEGGLEAEAYTFMQLCGIDDTVISDETLEDIKDFYRQVYQHSKFEVKDAVKADNGFYVEVVIEPIDIFQLAYDDMDAYTLDFNARLENGEFESYSAEEFELTYTEGMLEICLDYVDQIGYLEAESIVVTVAPDGDGLYTISDEDFMRLDAKVIQY